MNSRTKTVTINRSACTIPEKQWYQSSHNLLTFLILTGIAIAFIVTSPVRAGEQYMSGSTELSSSIAGTKEFSPGEEVQLEIVIQNTRVSQLQTQKISSTFT